jgi:hypothetical protein
MFRFSYRVVANRRDIEGPRLERVQIPARLNVPTLRPPPAPPPHLETPEPPERGRPSR